MKMPYDYVKTILAGVGFVLLTPVVNGFWCEVKGEYFTNPFNALFHTPCVQMWLLGCILIAVPCIRYYFEKKK